MSKYMSAGNRPKSNTESRLTPNRGRSAGERSGSAPKETARKPPRASRPALRRFFAPGIPAAAEAAPGGSGGPPGDVDELATTLGRPSRGAGVVAVELAAVAPAGGAEMEASSRPGTAAGPAIEPVAQPAKRGHSRVGRWVDVPANAARANPSTPPPDGTAATWR